VGAADAGRSFYDHVVDQRLSTIPYSAWELWQLELCREFQDKKSCTRDICHYRHGIESRLESAVRELQQYKDKRAKAVTPAKSKKNRYGNSNNSNRWRNNANSLGASMNEGAQVGQEPTKDKAKSSTSIKKPQS